MIKTVVGSFDTFVEAAQAERDLRLAGFLESDINIIANDTSRIADTAAASESPEAATHDTQGTTAGMVSGGALGGVAGLAASLLGVAIPGIGSILAAGPVAAALTGAGAGAVAGGLIGGLTDMGIAKSDAENYVEAVRRGGALVTIRADSSRADEAEAVLRRCGAVDISQRVLQWQSEGWRGYDPEAKPLSAQEIQHERQQYRSTAREREAEETQLRR